MNCDFRVSSASTALYFPCAANVFVVEQRTKKINKNIPPVAALQSYPNLNKTCQKSSSRFGIDSDVLEFLSEWVYLIIFIIMNEPQLMNARCWFIPYRDVQGKGLPAEDSVTTTPRSSTFHYSTGSSGPQTKYSGTTYIWRAKRLISISTCKVSSCPSRFALSYCILSLILAFWSQIAACW